MPVYNGEKYLNYSIKTIQNQNLKEIEIILIDDFSTDNSLNIIQRLMEEDPRIRLIKNFRNRKILYSKSIGALNSKGEFLLELDQDDMFIREDLFDIIYNESQKYDLDIVQFREIIKNDTNFQRITRINFANLHWIYPKKTFSMTMPELKNSLFRDHNNYLLWGLLMNAQIYKKAIYEMWEFIMNYQLIFNEDYAITTRIISLSHNYKYLNLFGMIHLKHQQAASFNCSIKIDYQLSNIFFTSFLFNYYVKNSPENINLIYNYINSNKIYQINASRLFPHFSEFNIRNILYNNYLLNNNKNDILKMFNIGNNKTRILSSYEYFMNISEFNMILEFQNYIINISNKNNAYLNYIIKNHSSKLNQIKFDFIHVNEKNWINDINKIIIINKTNHEEKIDYFYYKVSIIIYCKELKFLEQTLISIIEQKGFYFFEIIIVYDDINKLDSNNNFAYNNIYIINNLIERGIMYSFSIGALLSKSKYVLNIQSGYTFTKNDFLFELYKLASKKGSDVLEFNLLINKDTIINDNSFNLYKCHHFNSNLNTSIIKYNKNYKEFDQEKELLINKLIRTEIYQNIIEKYKLMNYKEAIYNNYDEILLFLIMKRKYNFKRTDMFGIIKNINQINSLRLKQIIDNNEQKINDSIFYINFLFEHSDNEYEVKKAVYEQFINKLGFICNKFVIKSNNTINLYRRIMNCNSINKIDKMELKFFYKSLNN